MGKRRWPSKGKASGHVHIWDVTGEVSYYRTTWKEENKLGRRDFLDETGSCATFSTVAGQREKGTVTHCDRRESFCWGRLVMKGRGHDV